MTAARQASTGGLGLLVLGMHRSGTSALSRVLGLCGFDLGQRVLGAGPGNETGHWEDAFAVELHERLLTALGGSWDDPPVIPPDWLAGEAGRAAVAETAGYLRSHRAAHPRWAVKDPRLCLFAPVWKAAANVAGQSLAGVVMVRHPLEVARSLAARDGLPQGRGLVLWLEYSLAMLETAQELPHVVVDYLLLLNDWKAVLGRLATLPGLEGLRADAAAQAGIASFLDVGRKHQAATPDDGLPRAVAKVWDVLLACVARGRVDPAAVQSVREEVQPVRELVHPMLQDWRLTRRQLWARIARAEAPLVDESLRLQPSVDRLSQGIEANRADLIQAVSGELRRMQEITAQAVSSAASLQTEARLAGGLAPRLDQLEAGLARRMDAEMGRLQEEARRARDETALERERAAAALQSADQLTRQLEASQAEAALERGRTAGALGSVDELTRQLEASQAETALERGRTAGALGSVDELTRQLEASQAETALERERTAGALGSVDRLTQQMHASLAKARDEMAAVQAEGQSLREALGQSEAAAAALQTQIHGDAGVMAEQRAQLQQQSSEIATLSHEIENLREMAAQLDRVKTSRSWRWTRPLRGLGRVLRGELSLPGAWELTRGQRANRRDALPVLTHDVAAAGIVLAPQTQGLPDVFVWSVIDWHFRTQRPQHIASALARKGHRVFYLSNNFVDSPEPGFDVSPLDADGRLFQVHLNLAGKPPIYFGMPDAGKVEALRASLARLLAWSCTQASISLVQHPYWSPLVRALPAALVVYDCMDHHGGFDNNAGSILEAEAWLVEASDLVIVTSAWLEQEVKPRARATAMVRNAGDFDFFRTAPEKTFRDPRGRKVIGYFGAIAEWFDVDLVRRLAQANPDALVLLVGNDTCSAADALRDQANVRMVGEVPYADLPYWLHGFDVCLLPFKVMPLTLATNPVKVYEYLAAGKPVVCIDLPEMVQFDGLVRVAATAEDFVRETALAVAQGTEAGRDERQAFAANQTWAHRAEAIDAALAALPDAKVSVIVLTYNNLAFTEACLFSIEAYSDYRHLEVIVVDNASRDGSPEWLQAWVAEPSDAGHQRRLILNADNLGFSAGNNVGLRAATGDVLVLLNNDTYVTPGWVRGLCNHLQVDPGLGLVGPVTNNIGNEARIEMAYADMSEMIRLAGTWTRAHPGVRTPMRCAAFFCVAMRRGVYERIGDMDEAFGVGFFEDDDYCRRVEAAGLSIACADDVFVHHHLSASFDALKADTKRELFERNRAIYEAKWGAWEPHAYRREPPEGLA